MKTLLEWLGENPVFSSLSESQRALLAKRTVERKLKKGEVLAVQGSEWPHLFLVARGQIDAVKVSSQGRELVIASFGPGEIFWGPSIFVNDFPLPATLEAASSSLVYIWYKEDLVSIFISHGQAAWEICRLMVRRMLRASTVVEELAFQPVAGRLARLLVQWASGRGTSPIPRSLTLDDIAGRIGSTREVVCRLLHQFADEGWIDITRAEWVVRDLKSLKELADSAK